MANEETASESTARRVISVGGCYAGSLACLAVPFALASFLPWWAAALIPVGLIVLLAIVSVASMSATRLLAGGLAESMEEYKASFARTTFESIEMEWSGRDSDGKRVLRVDLRITFPPGDQQASRWEAELLRLIAVEGVKPAPPPPEYADAVDADYYDPHFASATIDRVHVLDPDGRVGRYARWQEGSATLRVMFSCDHDLPQDVMLCYLSREIEIGRLRLPPDIEGQP